MVDSLPAYGGKAHFKLSVYPGGHMFYSCPANAASFKADAKAIYGAS